MVILFSNRKNKCEKEIIEILLKYGASYISDKCVSENKGKFTILSTYKNTKIELNYGIAVIIDDTERFSKQTFPIGITGICEDNNTKALEIFKNSGIAVISCGICGKNTITLSSINNDDLLTSLQRTLNDNCGNKIDPSEFKIKLTKNYLPFSVMASVAILLINGITPYEFWILL